MSRIKADNLLAYFYLFIYLFICVTLKRKFEVIM